MKHLSIIVLCIGIVGCSQQREKHVDAARVVNVDSLSTIFLQAWNTADSAAVMNTIAANAVVMNDSMIHRGTDAIATRWISGGVKVISNIRTVSLTRDGIGEIAYDAGTYTLNLAPPGGPVLKEHGNYTLVWKKQNDGEWKLVLIHIEDVSRLPDIR